jgi:sugar (pentulose or hexulose) kinase
MDAPRGIAVLDVGTTNTKLLLFDAALNLVAEEKAPSARREGAPYTRLDPEATLELARRVLPEFDRILPVDVIVPSTHGSGLALLGEDGQPALPLMAYWALPPEPVRAAYRAIEPPFAEVCCPLNPMALTLGLQLFWQETAFPDAFARVRHVLPLAQYYAHRLGGRMASEVTALGAQTQLWEVRANRFSSLARGRGWDRLFAPMARAWERVGTVPGLRGRGGIAAGVHDSNANWLRYLADGRPGLTLLSTGTWIIGFDSGTDVATLDPARDTASNTDVFGRPVASGRFLGGGEIATVAQGAPAEAASLEAVARLIAQGSFAFPSFSDSGGPLPGTGGQGRLAGPLPQDAGERASLGALYCALMTSELLDAIRSRGSIVIDGPFAANPVFAAILAAIRAPQPVAVSRLTDGTAAGAAVLGLMPPAGTLPRIPLELAPVTPPALPGLAAYRARWQVRASPD